MYLAGVVGLQVEVLQPLFRLLIPFNLLTSLALLLLFHTDWNRSFLLYCVVAFCAGFLVEVAGVHTGLIFGSYQYGTALGWQLWEVPLVIGTNWLMLTYACGSVCDRLGVPSWVKALAAAALMTGLDVLIEPVAIRLGFWDWNSAEVPLQNYVAWYVVSAILLLLFYRLPFSRANRLALLLLLLQFFFFGISTLFIFW
jgi:putative membrane protein